MEDKNLNQYPQESYNEGSKEAMLFGMKDQDKIDDFEALLSKDLKVSDNISEAIEKMVKSALVVEFGEKIMAQKTSKNMVSTIASGIMSDSELRKQALIIMDKFAKPEELNA